MPLTLRHADTTRQFGHEYFTRNIYTSILTIRPTSPEYADDTTNYLLLCLEFNQPREQLQSYLLLFLSQMLTVLSISILCINWHFRQTTHCFNNNNNTNNNVVKEF